MSSIAGDSLIRKLWIDPQTRCSHYKHIDVMTGPWNSITERNIYEIELLGVEFIAWSICLLWWLLRRFCCPARGAESRRTALQTALRAQQLSYRWVGSNKCRVKCNIEYTLRCWRIRSTPSMLLEVYLLKYYSPIRICIISYAAILWQ